VKKLFKNKTIYCTASSFCLSLRRDLPDDYITGHYTVATVQGMVWFGTALVLSGLATLLSTVSGLSPSAKEKWVS
jgi:hypothetical protein